MRLKYLLGLLVAVLLALPQFAYSQEEEDNKEEYADPNQPEIDSLLNAIKPNSPDSVKAKNYTEIALITGSVDTTLKYAFLALDFCNETDKELIASCNRYIAWGYYMNDQTRIGLPYLQKSTNLLQSINADNIDSNYSLLAYFYEDLNKIDSTKYYINLALELEIKKKDTAKISNSYKALGSIYGNKGLYKDAEQYYWKALELDSLIRDSSEFAYGYFRIGELYANKSDEISDTHIAKKYLTKSIHLQDMIKSMNSDRIIDRYLAYNTLADVYITLANNHNNNKYADSCFYYIKKTLDYFIKQGLNDNAVGCGYIYMKYLKYYKKYDEALAFMLRQKKYLDGASLLSLRDYYSNLKELYICLGDYKNAYECFEKETEYKDANLNDSSMSALADMKTEQAMMLEKIDRENAEKLHAAEKQKMRIVIFSLIGGLALISLLVFYIFRVLRIKKKANADLLEKNAILIEQKEEIQAQRDEIEEQKEEIEAQRDEIMAQRDHIEAQSKEIQSSINYARRIQRSMLTPAETISGIFPDYFLLYKPRDIVSGDYYWVGQFGDNKVCIVADCTGHGVPGGFLSVLGMSNLNYIVGQDVSPDTILNRLREAIITNLRQSDNSPSALQEEEESASAFFRSSDGMDAAVYVINERQRKLSFAGANNPLVLIRGDEVQVLKGDRMPVGIYARLNPFQCTTIDIQRGDCLYTFSDGFQDQFESGGTFDKFSARRLRELLLEIHQHPMSEQKEILNRTYEEWRGPAENQTDDVVIMGVRI